MVFASVCENASGAFIFASTRGDNFSLEQPEHFRK